MSQETYVCYVIAFKGEGSLLANNYVGCIDMQDNEEGTSDFCHATQFDTKEEAEKAKEELYKKHDGIGYFEDFKVAKMTITDKSVSIEWE